MSEMPGRTTRSPWSTVGPGIGLALFPVLAIWPEVFSAPAFGGMLLLAFLCMIPGSIARLESAGVIRRKLGAGSYAAIILICGAIVWFFTDGLVR